MEISAKGTRLAGVRANLAVGDTIRIGYHHRTARFRIKWLAVAGNSPRETHVGVECLEPDKTLWPVRLPVEGADHYESSEDGCCSSGRRRHARFAVSGTACVSKFGGGLGTWVKICDISLSGCYLQTSEPLNLGHRVTLLIKVADAVIEANGVVSSSDSMSGMGVGFTHMTAPERRKLTRLVAHLEQNLIPHNNDDEIETGRGLKAAATRIQRRIVDA